MFKFSLSHIILNGGLSKLLLVWLNVGFSYYSCKDMYASCWSIVYDIAKLYRLSTSGKLNGMAPGIWKLSLYKLLFHKHIPDRFQTCNVMLLLYCLSNTRKLRCHSLNTYNTVCLLGYNIYIYICWLSHKNCTERLHQLQLLIGKFLRKMLHSLFSWQYHC